MYDPIRHALEPVADGDLRSLAIGRGQSDLCHPGSPAARLRRGCRQADAHLRAIRNPGCRMLKFRNRTTLSIPVLSPGMFICSPRPKGLASWFHNCDRAGLAADLRLRAEQRALFGQTIGYPRSGCVHPALPIQYFTRLEIFRFICPAVLLQSRSRYSLFQKPCHGSLLKRLFCRSYRSSSHYGGSFVGPLKYFTVYHPQISREANRDRLLLVNERQHMRRRKVLELLGASAGAFALFPRPLLSAEPAGSPQERADEIESAFAPLRREKICRAAIRSERGRPQALHQRPGNISVPCSE